MTRSELFAVTWRPGLGGGLPVPAGYAQMGVPLEYPHCRVVYGGAGRPAACRTIVPETENRTITWLMTASADADKPANVLDAAPGAASACNWRSTSARCCRRLLR
ncbi:hypothetical protein MJ561_04545 [Klebsiella pneumoniae]|nr:hypothetical protein MJ561_04545 [Klebsiella pneumoniae]